MTTLLFDSPSQLFTIHAATPAALCSTAVVGGLAVSRTSHRDTDNSGTSRSPIRADLCGIDPAATHRNTKLSYARERKDDDATPAVSALVPALPVSLCAHAGQQKSFLNNRAASCNPSSVSTTDFALLMGSEI